MSRGRCVRCGGPAKERWQLRPCAIGKPRWYSLCLSCDLWLNALVIAFLRVPNGATLLSAYIDRKASRDAGDGRANRA